MSFSYQTENLGLPIWGSNDKPTQDDLNYMNNKIDSLNFQTNLNSIVVNKYENINSKGEPLYTIKNVKDGFKNIIGFTSAVIYFSYNKNNKELNIRCIPYDYTSLNNQTFTLIY